ncbi:Uncharacterized protein GBIM_00181 [Gryllus bimaculatus]|nr:Uncharacterized protein GBIM_00181 [Gryllus bimaculatus]
MNSSALEEIMKRSMQQYSGEAGVHRFGHRSLADDVYKSTTVAENKFSVIESVKKAFSFSSGGAARRSDPLLTRTDAQQATPEGGAANRDRKMPASASAEETALLGTMPSDSMDDIELRNIQLQFPQARTMSREDSQLHEERVETGRGSVVVAVQGNRTRPAILTYHDLDVSGFQTFFNFIDMRALLENFCVYHGTEERNHDLVQVYRSYFERHVNPTNLALFIDSYIRRTDLNIVREMDPGRKNNTHTLSMPVINITGALSPHIQDCGMVLEEQPAKWHH